MQKIWLKLLQPFISLCVPVLLVIISVRLVMLPIFINFEYTRAGFPEDFYGFSTEDRLQYGVIAIEYLLNNEAIGFLAEQRLPIDLCWNVPLNTPDCAMFNENELIHMEDVKDVLQISFTVAYTLFIGLLLSGWAMERSGNLVILWRGIIHGSILTLMTIATIIIIALAAWDTFFDTFHALLFEDGTWRFLYSDTLIRLYPEQFWFDAAITVGILTSLGACSLLFLAWRQQRNTDQ